MINAMVCFTVLIKALNLLQEVGALIFFYIDKLCNNIMFPRVYAHSDICIIDRSYQITQIFS